jgi:hypothetical protein
MNKLEAKLDANTRMMLEILALVRAMAGPNIPKPGDEPKRLITKRNPL